MKMADDKKKNSKTEEIKEKFEDCKETVKEKASDAKETAKEKFEDCKEKVVKTDRMLVAFSLLAAWGSGCLAHKGGDNVPTAVLLGGENSSVSTFFPG